MQHPQLFRPPGPCFACGEMGHLRAQCPKTAGSTAVGMRKWYPFHVTSEHANCGAAKEVCAGTSNAGSGGTVSAKVKGDDGVECDRAIESEVLELVWEVEPENADLWEMKMQEAIMPVQVKGRLKKKVKLSRI